MLTRWRVTCGDRWLRESCALFGWEHTAEQICVWRQMMCHGVEQRQGGGAQGWPPVRGLSKPRALFTFSESWWRVQWEGHLYLSSEPRETMPGHSQEGWAPGSMVSWVLELPLWPGTVRLLGTEGLCRGPCYMGSQMFANPSLGSEIHDAKKWLAVEVRGGSPELAF